MSSSGRLSGSREPSPAVSALSGFNPGREPTADDYREWALIVARAAGALLGVQQAFAKRGMGDFPELRETEQELDALGLHLRKRFVFLSNQQFFAEATNGN